MVTEEKRGSCTEAGIGAEVWGSRVEDNVGIERRPCGQIAWSPTITVAGRGA